MGVKIAQYGWEDRRRGKVPQEVKKDDVHVRENRIIQVSEIGQVV